jgi:hypothetical protein
MNTFKAFIGEVLRWILRAFVFPLLTLFIAVIIIFNVIPQSAMREFAADQIRERIHRQVDIGTLHLGLRGLSVDSLRLSEVPTFSAGTLFEAKGLRLGWNLRSLWEGLSVRKQSITKSSGRFTIDDFRNPHYVAHDFSVRWSLSDIDPSGAHLNGWAKLDQGPGLLKNIDQLMATSPSAKIALAPVLALINLEKFGFLKIGLPDLRHWPIHAIRGDYIFKDGIMTIREFTIESPQLGMGTTGTVDLAGGKLLLNAELHAPKTTVMGELDATLRVSGTTANPQVDLSHLKKKAFRATITNLLESPENVKKNIDATIKNLFH